MVVKVRADGICVHERVVFVGVNAGIYMRRARLKLHVQLVLVGVVADGFDVGRLHGREFHAFHSPHQPIGIIVGK